MAIFELSMVTGAIVEMGVEVTWEKAKRRETVLKLLKHFKLDPGDPPTDFDSIYTYTLIEYGVFKPEPILNFFRNEFVREAFRQSFYKNDPSILEREAEGIIQWNEETGKLGEIDYDPRREFAAFSAVFNEIVDRTRTPAEVKRDRKLDGILAGMGQVPQESHRDRVEVTPRRPSYREYLQRIVSDLQDWEAHYAPLFAKFERLTLFAQMGSKRSSGEPLLNLIARNPQMVVLGVAGAGKTTTLRRVALEAAQKAFKGKASTPIPILVSLRDYSPPSVEALIAAKFGPWGLTFNDIRPDLQSGRFLLIFDGVNEVTEARRDECCKELRHLMESFPHNRYLFTARPLGHYADCFAVNETSPPICTILPLTRRQIEDYIHRYFGDREDTVVKLIKDLNLHDEDAWKNPGSLVHLAKVPLLLQMLILTFEAQRRIPRNEGELLLRYVDYILSEREPGKMVGRFRSEVKKQLLAAIAWEMREQGLLSAAPRRLAWNAFVTRLQELQDSREVSPAYVAEDIWQEIQNNHLLIVEEERVLWPHPLFQDLFVGLELRGLCFDEMWTPRRGEIDYRFPPLRAKWFGDPWFDNGITMLEIVPPDVRVPALVTVSAYNLDLAWQAYLRMEPEYEPELREDCLAGLEKASLSSLQSGDQHRNLVNMIGRFNDVSAIYRPLQEIAQKCPTWQGRHQALYELWGKCRTDFEKSVISFIRTASESDQSDQVRIAALDFLVRVADEELASFLIERLLTDTFRVAEHLQQQMEQLRRSPAVLDRLRQVARSRHSDIARRCRAIWALGESGTTDISVRELLRKIAQKERDGKLRREAVRALRNFPWRATVNTLRQTVHDAERLVRIESISSLDACSRFNTTTILISALADGDSDVGTAAIDALVAIGQKRGTIELLVEATYSDNALIRRRAITTLARLAASDHVRIALKAAKELRFHTGEKDKEALLEVAWGLNRHYIDFEFRLILYVVVLALKIGFVTTTYGQKSHFV